MGHGRGIPDRTRYVDCMAGKVSTPPLPMLVHTYREGLTMPRKEKPMPKRAKPARDNSPVYTTAEVCERHQISRRTLRRWGMERGFPEHWRSGRNEVYAKAEVHAWEHIHTPKLWPKPPEPPKSAEDKHWDRMRAHYLIDKAEAEDNPPPPKPSRPSRRAGA